jgi:hypothetical protein
MVKPMQSIKPKTPFTRETKLTGFSRVIVVLEGIQSATTRKLMSTAWAEVVSAPTEMKLTPVSA